MPRVVTASLLALIIYPHLLLAQGTRLWVQSRYEDFEKGQPESTAIASRRVPGGWARAAVGIVNPLDLHLGCSFRQTGKRLRGHRLAGDRAQSYSCGRFHQALLQQGPHRAGGTGWPGRLGVRGHSAREARSTASSPASPVSTRAPPPSSSTPQPLATMRPRPSQADQARYIWDLAFDAQGALYIATGGPAAIYRVDVATDTPHAESVFRE